MQTLSLAHFQPVGGATDGEVGFGRNKERLVSDTISERTDEQLMGQPTR